MRWTDFMRCAPPLWVLILLSIALWGGAYARRGLWEPDEARYAYVAREMRADGHWFVPHINGRLYPDKPPLIFWMINASSLLTGGRINGISARLPSLLGAILTLWVVSRLLVRWHSAEAAWRAMLILPTSYMFWHEGGWGRIDALLCGLVMMSVYMFITSLEKQRLRREAMAYVFAGLAVFAKGPVGLAVPVGIFLAVTLFGEDRRKLKRWHWVWGPLVAVAIPGAWLLMAWRNDAPPEYFAAVFGEKSFGRAVASIGHDRPFHYFLWHFPPEFMPWTLFLPAAAVAISDRLLKRRLLAWFAFVIVFFSLFVCKRNVYILAAYPAAAMLIAAAWEDIARLPSRWRTVTGVLAIVPVCFLAVAACIALFIPAIPINRLAILPSAVLMVAGAVLLVRIFRRESLSQRWLLSFCALFLLVQSSVSAFILPAANKLKSPVEAAEAMSERLLPGQHVYLFQQQLAIIPFYANRPGREIHSVEALRDLIARGDQPIVVFKDYVWREVEPQLSGIIATAHEFEMGHKHLHWVEFSAAE